MEVDLNCLSFPVKREYPNHDGRDWTQEFATKVVDSLIVLGFQPDIKEKRSPNGLMNMVVMSFCTSEGTFEKIMAIKTTAAVHEMLRQQRISHGNMGLVIHKDDDGSAMLNADVNGF
jgi:hypothetical protein